MKNIYSMDYDELRDEHDRVCAKLLLDPMNEELNTLNANVFYLIMISS